MNLHEREERDFGQGPALWDADPDVCCAAFQLGACEHTESYDYERELDEMPFQGYDASQFQDTSGRKRRVLP